MRTTSTSSLNSSAQSSISDYSSLVCRCVDLASLHAEKKFTKDAAQLTKEYSRILGLLWGSMGQLVATTLPRNLKACTDSDHPGYVFIKKGRSTFAVPFFIAELFPKGALLAEIGLLANKIKIQDNSVFCISGSGCSLGADIPVADIDFCEYLPSINTNTVEGLIGAARLASPDCVCHRVSVDGDQTWAHPWPEVVNRPTTELLITTTAALNESTKRKVDFVANLQKLGVLEVTNRLLVLDFAYSEVGEGRSSYSLQEVPLDTTQWVPRVLSDPLELGRYLIWLEKTTQELLLNSASDPRSTIKLLRRAMSLGRILMARDETQELYELLKDEDSARLAALHDRCELFGLVAASSDPALQNFKDELIATIAMLRKGKPDENDASIGEMSSLEKQKLERFSLRVKPALVRLVQSLSNKMRHG